MNNFLFEETKVFGEEHFYGEYEVLEWEEKTIRHIGLHVAKAGMKLVNVQLGRQTEEVIVDEVIADLQIYRNFLLQLTEIEPETVDWSGINDMQPAQSISIASGLIAEFVEPKEHTHRPNRSVNECIQDDGLILASVNLHHASIRLSEEFEINPAEAHKKRMLK